jgi:hypothetical protein
MDITIEASHYEELLQRIPAGSPAYHILRRTLLSKEAPSTCVVIEGSREQALSLLAAAKAYCRPAVPAIEKALSFDQND